MKEKREKGTMEASTYKYITLREAPERMTDAAEWFSSKWRVPKSAYLACMDAYLKNLTEYRWYLCFCGNRIVGGLEVIENDFHDRKKTSRPISARYTPKKHTADAVSRDVC